MTRVSIDEEKITAFCRKHHIHRLALFASALRGESTADSDLDVLVEFEPDHVPGLAFFAMETELSELLGHRVDLNTAGFLSPHFRDQVLAEAEVRYAQEG